MDDTKFVLNVDDISNIVNALEMFITCERFFAISENRYFNRSIQSTLTYLRDYENLIKRSEAKYVTLSYSL